MHSPSTTKRSTLRGGRLSVFLLCFLAGVARLHAQQEEDDAQMALGSGRMVRGTVTVVTHDHLTLKTEQEGSYQVVLTPNTRLRKGRDPVKVTDVHVGDGLGAMGIVDEPKKTVHALFIGIIDADQIRKGREAMGKTFIWGRVTAINDLKLTLVREDGVSQVIAVDEDTSFKRGRGFRAGGTDGPVASQGGSRPGDSPSSGRQPANGEARVGESITLGDVKVGDTVAGPGTLKRGTFTPAELQVVPAGAMGDRRRRGAAGPPE